MRNKKRHLLEYNQYEDSEKQKVLYNEINQVIQKYYLSAMLADNKLPIQDNNYN